MIWLILVLSLLCAIIPAALFCANLRLYAEPPVARPGLPAVSILIPARNESAVIGHAITHALATRNIDFEIVIMDDGSTDGTPHIVSAIAAQDPRVRLENAPPLPAGWNGKQHACWALANAARYPLLCFVDADVTLGPDCVARMAQFLQTSPAPHTSQHDTLEHDTPKHDTPEHDTPEHDTPEQSVRPSAEAGISVLDVVATDTSALRHSVEATNPNLNQLTLVSGFPRQTTVTVLEWLLLPLIHFVLLGFLPLAQLRKGTDPAFAAGCGQFFVLRRDVYFATGGHSQIKLTMHDGLRLPRLFRAAGHRTDLADITNLATCRMYTTAGQVWSGLAKNATEGIADPKRILPVTLILLLGQVLPFLLTVLLVMAIPITIWMSHTFIMGVNRSGTFIAPMILIALIAAWLPRWLSASRFKQDWRSALFHPLGILVLLVIQWYALFRKLRGGPVSWRGRAYTTPHA